LREEGVFTLFAAAKFTDQKHNEDHRQDKQGEHEEKSETHHGNYLLSYFV